MLPIKNDVPLAHAVNDRKIMQLRENKNIVEKISTITAMDFK